jgi:hypothetical protein
MFKLSITTITLLLSLSTFASVDCAKVNGRLYPVSESAIKVANHLKVSTCSGKRFEAAMSHLNTTINEVAPSTELIQRLDAVKAEKLAQDLKGLSL